jgi:hypothetical protein
MLRRMQAFLVSGVWLVVLPAAAQEPTDAPPQDSESAEVGTESAAPEESATREAPPTPDGSAAEAPPPEAPAGKSSAEDRQSAQVGTPPAAGPPTPEVNHGLNLAGWDTFATGYFRAPMAIGISQRPGPDAMDGPAQTQLSYGPNRTVDANYYSFAYTRLQEQDWVELFIHAKKKHVEAVVGWMGYWFQSAGFRNNDAAWVPGMAYLTLDTDFQIGGLKPNIALTAGAWWPKFGYFEKYDTYTLGQYRQLGEQVRLTIPVNPDLTLTLVQGFGTGRDGSSSILVSPPYQATVGLDLLHYEHVRLAYKEYVDVGLHFNYQWTRDPNLSQQASPGQAYADAREAKFSTFGGEANLSAPFAGRLWISPSYTRIRNGWALGEAGIELMHSLSGEGFASNYLGWDQSAPNSTGTGSSFNLGFLYENTLSGILGKAKGSSLPEVTLNVFGLYIDARLDLPTGSAIPQDRIAQLKYGADVTVQALDWLGFMLRWDEVNYDLDHSGFVFSAISPRVIFSSHFLSGESIYIQYSRYRYGEDMVLAGTWPWGQPLVAGSNIVQSGPYAGDTPDRDVIRLQATVAF